MSGVPWPFRFRFKWCATVFAAAATVASTGAAEFFVAPEGVDTNPGTRAAPFNSFRAAQQAARQAAGRAPVTVTFADGVYYLPSTVIFTPADSGTAARPVVYRAAREGGAVLSGGRRLNLAWTVFRSQVLQATTPEGMSFDQLFLNGHRQPIARYPNRQPDVAGLAFGGFAADAFSPERALRWSDPAGGYIHAMHRFRWGGYHYRITHKNERNEIAYEGGWQNNRQLGMHAEQRFVENIFEELDAPGEWFHSAATRTLYFWPPAAFDPATAEVEAVQLAHLVEFQGSAAHPVAHVALEGFVFRHAARTFMLTKEPLLRSDWAIYRGGAVVFRGALHCRLSDIEFDQVGGNAVFVDGWNRSLHFRSLHIHHAGASGVAFVGSAGAVRSPLFEHRQPRDWSKLDLTPGPKSDDYPADCVVEDCLIHHIGETEKQSAGVQIAISSRITVRHCSIYHTARAGININDGNFGGHLIEGCDVFDTVLETHDHGSFNSWGRDRFWVPDVAVVNQQVMVRPELPFLDAVETTVIRDSRWRCDHGWDIDLDDGSSNYEITNNLLLGGGLKLREGYRRTVANNVIVNNSMHPHVWPRNSGDVVVRNILMGAYRPAAMDRGLASNAKWGKEIDRNLFTTSHADRLRHSRHGCDLDSVVGDPLFIDPANGDFRVRPDSPAIALGFRNFPMDRFGVRKPALRIVARHPMIPQVEISPNLAVPTSAELARITGQVLDWFGATVRGLEGDEFSAFGVAREDGGVLVISLPSDSAAARLGLQPGDLIQSLGAAAIRTPPDLVRLAMAPKRGEAPKLIVVRQQQPIELSLRNLPAETPR